MRELTPNECTVIVVLGLWLGFVYLVGGIVQ